MCDNGDKIGFQYLEVNEKYQKTKYCLFSKDGSSTDFYESGFFYYPRFYFLKDELFVTNKHFSNFNLKNVWYLKQTSFVGKKSLDEMSKLPIEIYERKPFEIEEPYNPSTESYVKFKEFKEQMKQLYDSVKIGITVSTTDFEVLSEKLNCKTEVESSEKIRNRVNYARVIQKERYKEYGVYSNSELSPKLIEKYCKLNTQSSKLLENSFEKLGLSARAYGRILKVARTIADLDESENIEVKHIAEAIQYRSIDRKYWGN